MAAFEFGNYPERPGRMPFASGERHAQHAPPKPEQTPEADLIIPPPLKSEPILAMKIYDSCRYKVCLSPSELGPALDVEYGVPIVPPDNAQTVSIENLNINRIVILSKTPSPFRKGFWDAEIQYVFCYDLRFVGQGGMEIEKIPATNSYVQRVSLFGSVGSEVTVATDIFGGIHSSMGGEPFLIAEARAMPLAAEIKRDFCKPDSPAHVFAIIGLFSMVKLFRLVSLLVESRGFVIPECCGDVTPPDPCDYFEGLAFPIDTFSPPQKPEFMAGISADIPGRVALTDEINE